jgi:hypothetical protein
LQTEIEEPGLRSEKEEIDRGKGKPTSPIEEYGAEQKGGDDRKVRPHAGSQGLH